MKAKEKYNLKKEKKEVKLQNVVRRVEFFSLHAEISKIEKSFEKKKKKDFDNNNHR
jgi:hypothetical protein